VALGIQNSTVRKLAVPELTTTVLTMTITGLVADVRHSPAATTVRRLLAVATMLGGAVGGALLVLHTRLAWGLVVVLVLLAVVTVAATLVSRRPAPGRSWDGEAGPSRPRRGRLLDLRW
jgi:uncharacterized membrane protein YoaK (UPF0700 family)